MERWMGERMDGWMSAWMDVRIVESMDGCMSGWVGRWVDGGWMDDGGWMCRHMD